LKGIGVATWNILFFPLTVLENFYIYHQWKKLLHRFDLSVQDLNSKAELHFQFETISPVKAWYLSNAYQEIPKIDTGFIIEQVDKVIVFPFYHLPFFKKYKDPFIVSYTGHCHQCHLKIHWIIYTFNQWT